VDFWDFDDMVTGLNLIEGGGLLVHGKNRILRFGRPARQPMFSLPANRDPGTLATVTAIARVTVVGTMPTAVTTTAIHAHLRSNGQTPLPESVIDRSRSPNAISEPAWQPLFRGLLRRMAIFGPV
jgi:hypothetical protein